MTKNVRIGRTTNRTLGFTTTSASDAKCQFFHDRFIRHGSSIKENRAICDKEDETIPCDYRKEVDGISFCLRYWYGPKYEVVDELGYIPHIQKRDAGGNLLYYLSDGITETTTPTPQKVMIPIDEVFPIPYVKDNMEQETDASGALLFWDDSVYPPVQVTTDTGIPVLLPNSAMEFYSKQYEDTHEKIFAVRNKRLGWHHDE